MAIQTKTMKVKSDTALAETTTTIRDTVTFDTSKLPNGITYKGLKAVLSFADPIQWNKASTYDSLTVVWDDATHASYASKRPVPQNIELTNEFYWFRTADLDAQVEMYRQEVQQFDGRITANAQAIAAETARAEGAENTLTSSKKDKSVMVVFGDSFSVEEAGAGGSIGPLWWQLVSKELSMEADSFAVSGAGFIKYYSVSLNSEFERAKAKYNTEELIASVKRVYIFAGLNDLILNGISDTFFDTVGQFIAEVKAYFTNAYVTYANNFTPDPIARQGISLTGFNLYCKFKPNMPFMFNYISGATNLFRNDNGENFLHPNAEGESFIADMMLGRAEPVLQYSNSDNYFNKLVNCDKVAPSISKLGNRINANITVKITELSSESSFYFPSFYITNAVYDMYLPVYQSSTSQVSLANLKMQDDGLKLTIPAISDATPYNNTVYIPVYITLPDNRSV